MAGSQGTCLLYFITAVSQMEAPRKHQFTGQTDSRLYIKMDPACPAGPKNSERLEMSRCETLDV
uniref:Uncharacterized protein n=1 Tax=Anguilla anguilla TaxID=7936 RepID=A0A0E9PYR6_ANGAN